MYKFAKFTIYKRCPVPILSAKEKKKRKGERISLTNNDNLDIIFGWIIQQVIYFFNFRENFFNFRILIFEIW